MNADKKTTGAWDAEPTFGKADGKAQSKWSRLLRISLAACAIGAGFYAWSAPRTPCHGIPNKIDLQVKASEPLCPQTELLYPHLHKEYAESLDSSLKDPETKSWVLGNLVGAVRVP